jgi:hypothetical protein
VTALPGRTIALPQRHRIVALGHLALRVLRPGDRRPVGVAVERAVVEALRLEEHDWVVVLDGADQ